MSSFNPAERLSNMEHPSLQEYSNIEKLFFYQQTFYENYSSLQSLAFWNCRLYSYSDVRCGGYIMDIGVFFAFTHLYPQCEEERLCKHDTVGGFNIIQKHHLLHHTSCLCRSGKPQSSTPQQVWMCTQALFIDCYVMDMA